MATVPSRVAELVETFDQHVEAYRSQQYNETQLRREFIDPFFEALGWDVANVHGYAQAYKDVIHEDAIKVGGATKAPDYCFRIGGVRKFFLEAKKPSIDIKGDPHPAYQLRRYAWSAKLPLSVLTDFEEFAVYDCQVRPRHIDKADVARIMFFTYRDYPKHWDSIADVFSREAILKGSFDKFAASTKGKRGTSTVDKEFLAEIEKWRGMLARIIALRNTALSVREINFAVQRTIDRILFLRMCEDRGIETYGQLRAISSGDRNYPRLCEVFEKADQKYNSGLFHFHDEPNRDEPPDELTLNVIIDDKDLKWILHSLYYPQSPYEFSVLPAEILGNVYEQFLGKVITLTTGHRAHVDDKPEVKKAGGVYYTPSYIVDYIVKNTVGKLCEGKTPRKVSNLRILDPACGSGSFLIGAYQYLLDWHLKYYTENDPEKHMKGKNPKIFETNSIRHCEEHSDEAISNYRLTITEKKRILLNNIFGVDIDSQAVEVSKLSLLLKVLEGESSETIENQYRLFHERALPDLANNIKCGNSLIGPEFYDNLDPGSITEELQQRINAFDWQAEFPEIFNGNHTGFDAVIGNPPWLMAGYHMTDSLDYLRHIFTTARGKFDTYYLFIEKGLSLISNSGLFGMIVPNKFFHTKAASNLRSFLSEPNLIHSIVDFGDEQIFSGATNYSCILFLYKRLASSILNYARAKEGIEIIQEFQVPSLSLVANTWHFEEERTRRLFQKMESIGESLEKLTIRFGTGAQTGADSVLTLDSHTIKNNALETHLLRPILRGRDVRRYAAPNCPKLVVFPYKVKDNEFVLLSKSELQKYNGIYNLLNESKTKLSKRIWFGKCAEELSGNWYGMMYLDSYSSFTTPHLLTPSLSNRSNFALGTGDLFATGTAGVTSIILDTKITESKLYLLGLLNSSLLSFYTISHSPVFAGAYYKFSSPYLKKIPIRRITFSDPAEKALHDKTVKLVEQMLGLHKKLAAVKVPADKTRIQRQIDTTDKQIDQLVYDLYGLTEDEIKIVEGST